MSRIAAPSLPRSTCLRPTLGLRALVALVIALSACSGDDGGDTSGIEPLGLGPEGVGTCLQFDDAVGAEVTELPVIDCELAHSHEIFAVEDHPADVYPGFDALEDFAQLLCLREFERFVENSPFDSSLAHSWLVPTLDGWNDKNDREVLCVLSDGEAKPLLGSMRGTKA